MAPRRAAHRRCAAAIVRADLDRALAGVGLLAPRGDRAGLPDLPGWTDGAGGGGGRRAGDDVGGGRAGGGTVRLQRAVRRPGDRAPLRCRSGRAGAGGGLGRAERAVHIRVRGDGRQGAGASGADRPVLGRDVSSLVRGGAARTGPARRGDSRRGGRGANARPGGVGVGRRPGVRAAGRGRRARAGGAADPQPDRLPAGRRRRDGAGPVPAAGGRAGRGGGTAAVQRRPGGDLPGRNLVRSEHCIVRPRGGRRRAVRAGDGGVAARAGVLGAAAAGASVQRRRARRAVRDAPARARPAPQGGRLRARLARAQPPLLPDADREGGRGHGRRRRVRPAVPGSWICTQGIDGAHTHQGLWRHAFDFEVIGQDGRLSFSGQASRETISPATTATGCPCSPPPTARSSWWRTTYRTTRSEEWIWTGTGATS